MTAKATANKTVSGTQSLVHTFAECWSRPSLLALEVAWRWLFGAPALLLLYYEGARILTAAASQARSRGHRAVHLARPDALCRNHRRHFCHSLGPLFCTQLLWVLPLLAVGWSIVSGIGRNLVMRRYDPELPMKFLPLIVLQLLRVAASAEALSDGSLPFTGLRTSRSQARNRISSSTARSSSACRWASSHSGRCLSWIFLHRAAARVA